MTTAQGDRTNFRTKLRCDRSDWSCKSVNQCESVIRLIGRLTQHYPCMLISDQDTKTLWQTAVPRIRPRCPYVKTVYTCSDFETLQVCQLVEEELSLVARGPLLIRHLVAVFFTADLWQVYGVSSIHVLCVQELKSYRETSDLHAIHRLDQRHCTPYTGYLARMSCACSMCTQSCV